MPIIDLQQRIRELGRIRIGETKTSSRGTTYPSKLAKFRITSASRPLLERVAALYGGEVRDWTPQNSTLQQYEVYTESTRLPVLVPPQPVSQWYETWSGGGCKRRCDGAREMLSDKPCLCGPDPAQRVCKPTTRVNVMLREVEGVGVWRLETHGYHAAAELPQAAEFLARAGGYVDGFLTLEERRVVRDGETRQFMVPALDIGITAGELLAAGGQPAQVGAGQQQAVDAPQQRAALPAGKPVPDADQEAMLLRQIAECDDYEQMREMWGSVGREFLIAGGSPIDRALRERGAALAPKDAPAEPPPDSSSGDEDADAVWPQVMQAVPEDWSTDKVEQDFAEHAGVPVEQGTAQQMRDYLAALPERTKAAS